MASGEATSTGFAAGGAAVGGGVTTVRGCAWFCPKLALTLNTKHSPSTAMRCIRDIVVLQEHRFASGSDGKFFTAVVWLDAMPSCIAGIFFLISKTAPQSPSLAC